MPSVVVPPPYRGPTQGVGRIEVKGKTVRACLEEIDEQSPGFLELVLDGQGELHRFVRLFRNGEPLDAGALAAPLEPRDELEIVAAIGGG